MGQPLRQIFLIALTATAACREGTACTGLSLPAINVVALDSVTGVAVAREVAAVARENAYVDTLRAFSDSMLSGVYDRAGRYQVEVSHLGYAVWRVSGVRVTRDECHVHPVIITARLVPH